MPTTTNRETPKAKILIVDVDTGVRRELALLLNRNGFQPREAASLTEASRILVEEEIDLVLSDLKLGDDYGIDLVRLVKQGCPGTESILVTARGSSENSMEAMQAGASDYITKPFSDQELLLRINRAVERKRMREEIVSLRQHVAMSYGFDNIVGLSKPLQQVKEAVRRIAPTDITVLITGASGTGKELFARAIHHHSLRRNGPFIAIDCSAIPEALMESELFGHDTGAYPSASQDRKGLLEEADGGTVFFDEVGNMPPTIQVKLLRFLQDPVIRRVGSAVTRKVNVRIIAAADRELSATVADGRFREDLYHRLNVIPIRLPDLTERREDIEILTDYFLRRICRELDRPTLSIAREAVDKLLDHTWPGNVRELENTLKRAAALCTGEQLRAGDIILLTATSDIAATSPGPERTSLRLKGNLLDSTQRSLIIKALNDNNWNYTKTAGELGIGRTTLWRKIKKYSLRREVVAG